MAESKKYFQTMPSLIDTKRIRTDLDTQSRVALNEDVVKEYMEAMEAGNVFPAILVFYDDPNDQFILADGFHRFAAHQRLKPNDMILAEQRLGTVADARWENIGANKSHGLRRTNAELIDAKKKVKDQSKTDVQKSPPTVFLGDGIQWIEGQESCGLILTDPPNDIQLTQLLIWSYKNTLGNNPKDRYKQKILVEYLDLFSADAILFLSVRDHRSYRLGMSESLIALGAY